MTFRLKGDIYEYDISTASLRQRRRQILEKGGKTSMTERIALKVEEAAEYTGIGRNTVRNLIKARKIPHCCRCRSHTTQGFVLARSVG